jgi:RNA 2',3'-cyclic 3'-phosphodiesterase
MRLFIAIPIPDEIKRYISSIQQVFHSFPLRFVKPEQMHLTIDFLGEVPEEKIENIVRDLGKIRFNAFNIRLTDLGSFPSKDKIRVIWIGIDKNEDFIELQENIRKVSNHRGKLMPHLTIARAYDLIKDKSLMEKIVGFNTESQEFPVDRFILFKSEPTSGGYEHHIIKEFFS